MSDKFQMFINRLQKVYKHRSKIARRQNISCYRLYDHDIPEFPFCIEVFEDKLYVAEYLRRHGMEEEEHTLWLEECVNILSSLLDIQPDKIFIRERKRKQNRQSQYEKIGLSGDYFEVEENGHKFFVNLEDYLDTGLFLDHRITRKMVEDEAKGKRVLNLFCYTGSFSVYAAAGGAISVTSVDLSKTYLQWAEKNFELNQLQNNKAYHFVHADVLQYLKQPASGKFDLIVIDPPTFSNSKRMKDFFDIQRDHPSMLNDALKLKTPDGVIYFSTNSSKFVLEQEKINAVDIKDITKQTTPFDFEGKLKRWCFRIK